VFNQDYLLVVPGLDFVDLDPGLMAIVGELETLKKYEWITSF
jgi:hypothetical protein